MEKARRWSVTYTKHVKQKRKVYQDGVLQLDSSGNKVKLYDDCEQLLDSRFVNLDDVVKAGETITFGAYLVDIGDPEGDCKPILTSNFQEREAKIVNRRNPLHANMLKNNSTCTGNRKNMSGMYKTIPSNLSPSQKIIREFKKTELKKYEASASSPNTIKEITTEWQVLYTTQITKKAKTFHDGSLRLTICGSQGRQAMLYDATGRVLDSRFLKKDEMVISGESLTFDGHLVDIGECVGGHKPPTESNVQRRNCNEVQRAGMVHKEQSQTCNKLPLGFIQTNNEESGTNISGWWEYYEFHSIKHVFCLCLKAPSSKWDAMYTTQTTQRSKKYHDGVIRLASCGSSRMQATLLAEDGTILGRKFLNLSEDISSGSTFQLPNYLVEVGEPRRHREGEHNEDSVSKYQDVKVGGCLAMDNTKLSTRVPANRPLREPQDSASPLQDTKSMVSSSSADNIISVGKVLDNKPLRNAHAILSVLKRPNTGEGNTNVKGKSLDQGPVSQSSGFVQLDIQNHVQGQSVQGSCGRRIKIEDCKEETFTMHNFNDNALENLVPVDQSVETIVSEKISSREHDLDPPVAVALSFDSEGPTDLEPCDASKRNEKNGDLTKVLSSKAASNLKLNDPSEELKHRDPQQEPYGDIMDKNPTSHAEALNFYRTTSTDCISPNHVDIQWQASPQQKTTTIIDEFPCFDLGF